MHILPTHSANRCPPPIKRDMNNYELLEFLENKIREDGADPEVLKDMLGLCANCLSSEDCDKEFVFKKTNFVKSVSLEMLMKTYSQEYIEPYEDSYLVEAPHLFESYLWYMEKDREPKKQFYLPRKGTLKTVVDDLQDLEDGKIMVYGLSMPPRTGKSTLCIFFLTWIMGRHPNNHNAMGGHSGMLAKGFYKEVMNILTSAEYNFGTIFPKVKLESKSADEYTINLNKPDRFSTLTCRGIEGSWTGAVDISRGGLLYVDDLVRDREESLSPIRLENLYQSFLNVMVDRMQDGAKMLIVATRWGLFDPLGREEMRLEGNSKAKFRKISALNENDESNFQYTHDIGFSTEYYKEMRSRLDANEWQAKYQQKPFMREGLLLPADELNYFNGVIPDEEHYVACACDVAWGSGDSTSMPIGAVYDNAVYIIGWVFNNGDKYVTRPKVADAILKYKPQKVAIEGNNGGTEYAEDIDQMIRKEGYKTNITTPKASTKISKEGKIIQYAPDIKRTFYFLAPEKQPFEYKKAFEQFTMYTQMGKNPFDDAIDSLVQLFQLIDVNRVAKVEAVTFRL